MESEIAGFTAYADSVFKNSCHLLFAYCTAGVLYISGE
jgi:hypothetical protein